MEIGEKYVSSVLLLLNIRIPDSNPLSGGGNTDRKKGTAENDSGIYLLNFNGSCVRYVEELPFSFKRIINQLLNALGMESINFMSLPEWFRPIYVISGSWQSFGFNSIIFVAAIMGISPDLYEAMKVDVANKRQVIWHLVLPSIRPTIIMLLIMTLGSMMSVGFEKVYLLYNTAVYETADVIQTYVYRQGIQSNNYSYAAAVGLFNSVVNFTIVFAANKLSRKLTDTSIWYEAT